MSNLYANPETKIIFASDDAQDASIKSITAGDIAELKSEGYTVDSSAAAEDASATASGEASSAGGSTESAQSVASNNDPVTAATTIPTTTIPVSEVAAVPGEASASDSSSQSAADTNASSTDATAANTGTTASAASAGDAGESGAAAPDTSDTASASQPDTATSSAATTTPATGTSSSVATDAPTAGTTANVTQVGDQQVVTDIQQSGNTLAGSEPTTGNQLVNSGVTADAPALDGNTVTASHLENDLNPLVPAAGTEGAPASQLAAAAAEPEAEPLPKESHLMLFEAKFAALIAKAENQERIALDELKAIYAHVKAVL